MRTTLHLPDDVFSKLERAQRPLLATEVAELFRSSLGKVYRLARANLIPSFRFGGSVLFDPKALADRLRGTAIP